MGHNVFDRITFCYDYQIQPISEIILQLHSAHVFAQKVVIKEAYLVNYLLSASEQQIPFKTFLVFFSLCARLIWRLACQFFSTNHLSYRIVSHTVV